MMPATTREPRNCSNPPPMPATKPSAALARLPIFGCMLCTSAGRSVWALVQKACTLSPISGQFSTPSRGGGTSSVLFWMPSMSPCTESPSELMSAAIGTTTSTTPSSTISVAARPCASPEPAREPHLHRIQGDGQDQRPDHEVQERREHLEAQQHHRQDQPGSDQDVHQAWKPPGPRAAGRSRVACSWSSLRTVSLQTMRSRTTGCSDPRGVGHPWRRLCALPRFASSLTAVRRRPALRARRGLRQLGGTRTSRACRRLRIRSHPRLGWVRLDAGGRRGRIASEAGRRMGSVPSPHPIPAPRTAAGPVSGALPARHAKKACAHRRPRRCAESGTSRCAL